MGKIKKMMCQTMDAWTFSELVGAFLDLAIAYFLLCGSALAYFASKFLGLFGLCLPCPCNGFFGKPNKINNDNCLQSFLVDSPSEKISNVHFLAKKKFPLDSVLTNDPNSQSRERNSGKRHVGSEGEASCCLFSQGVLERESSMKEGRFDSKGKVVKSQRSRYGIRRRRKGSIGNDKTPLVSSFDPFMSDRQTVLESPGNLSKIGNEISEDSLVPVHLGGEGLDDGRGASKEDTIMPSHLNEPLGKDTPIEKSVSFVEAFKCDLQGQLGLDGNDINTIRILEQALEEEHAARSALYHELEKERSAAATAADEAMAMIFRLQEEKASIEMEARQYQRIIEEKSAYDAEEMNILKEILIMREREKHFLEKEVEAFRQMIFGTGHLDADTEDTESTQGQLASSLYFSEDPLKMLQQISKSIVDKENVKGAIDLPQYEVASIESQNYSLPSAKGSSSPELHEDVDSSKQGYIHKHRQHFPRNSDEKGMGSMDKNPIDQQIEVQIIAENSQFQHSATQVLNVREKSITPAGKKQQQADDTSGCQWLTSKSKEAGDDTKMFVQFSDGNMGKHGKDPRSPVPDKDICFYDVHVIGNEHSTCTEGGNNSENLSKDLAFNIPISCDSPIIDRSESEDDTKRSTSDVSSRMSSMGFAPGKVSLTHLRRNSMSAFDHERMKIDNEVGWLRERLKVVQEGREKLNFSAGHRGRERIQLQLLEDIANQLREIRQLTDPEKAARQASLPPLSSKVVSKKRRSRSISLATQKST